MIEEEFFTPEEVAAKLKLSKYTIYEMIKRGDLEAHRVGRGLRISSVQLELYLSKNRTDDNIFDAEVLQTEQGRYARLLHAKGDVRFHVSTDLTGSVRVSIEPENIIISHTKLICSARNVHKGTVIGIDQQEHNSCMLTLDIGVPLKVALTSYSVQEMEIKLGDTLYAIFKSMSVRVTAR